MQYNIQLWSWGSELFVSHLAIFDQQSHFEVDLLCGDERVRHYSSPKIVRLLRFWVSHQHLPLLYHELFRQNCHLAHHPIELIIAAEIASLHFFRNDPEANIECFHLLHSQLKLRMGNHIISYINCKTMFLLDLPCDIFPSISLKISPQFENIYHSPAHQMFVSDIEATIIWGTFLMKKIICLSTVRTCHKSRILA